MTVTTDLSIEGRHFRLDWHQPEWIGHRVLARGLSDLAAMGARPVAAFLSLGLPAALTTGSRGRRPWVDRFYDGLMALADRYKTPLGGGDLSESPIALADIVLIGAAPSGGALLRTGARAGDRILVTGRLGGAAAGLAALRQLAEQAGGPPRLSARTRELLAAHLSPEPRIRQGAALLGRATAAMDLSDGLSVDLARLCKASGVGAEVDVDRLPLAVGATVEQALNGGEDYELLFTLPGEARVPRSLAGVAVSQIGGIQAGSELTLVEGGTRRPLLPNGWQHFRG